MIINTSILKKIIQEHVWYDMMPMLRKAIKRQEKNLEVLTVMGLFFF